MGPENNTLPQPPSVPQEPTMPETTPETSSAAPCCSPYPMINIPHIENPSRFYAFPIIGALIKVIILIPVWFWLGVLGIVAGSMTLINSFVVLFKGHYWQSAYQYNLGVMRLGIKASFFLFGLTNKYPGFSRTIDDNFTVDIPYPENPNKLFAIPIIGGLIRFILLIPYLIYQQVIGNASNVGVVISFLPVLIKKRYPESTFELARDSVRVGQGSVVYMTGLSDKYPSFYISMNHKLIKITLIVLGILIMVTQLFGQAISVKKPQTFIQSPSRGSSTQLR